MKKFSKVFAVLASAAAAFGAVGLFAACDGEQPSAECQHQWSAWEISAPTETQKGKAEKACINCDEKREVELPFLDDDGYSKQTSATCTAAGTATYTITLQSEQFIFEVAEEATGHAYAEGWTKDENGHWHAATCGHATEKSGEAAHSYPDEWTVETPATCSSIGSQSKTCVCGYKTTNEIPLAGHAYAEGWTKDETNHWHAATCEHTSEKSGEAAHSYPDEWTVETPATCSSVGSQSKTCVCGYKITEEIPMTAHENLTEVDAVASTCTDQGTVAYWSCVCGKKFSDEAAATEIQEPEKQALAAHKGSYVNQVNQTCTQAGTKGHYTCNTCHKNFKEYNFKTEYPEEEMTIAPSHTITTVSARAATCTAAGNVKYYKCSRSGTGSCGNKYFSDQSATQEIVDKDSVSIAALGHVAEPEHNERVEATCLNAGNLEYWYCSQCKKNYADEACATYLSSVTISKTGHNYGEYVVTNPTAESGGSAVKSCTNARCDTAGGHKVTKTLPALTDPQYTLENSTATCTLDGTATYSIIVSSETITFEAAAQKGHIWYAKAIQDADDKTNVVKTCSMCNETEGELYSVDETLGLQSTSQFIDRKNYLAQMPETGGTASLHLVLDNKGEFKLSFANMTKVPVKLTGLTFNGTAALRSGAINPAYKNNLAIKYENDDYRQNVLTVTFTVDDAVLYNNVVLTFNFVNTDAQFVLTTEAPAEPEKTLAEGENFVVVKNTDGTLYTFTPSETKTMSLTVPAGVSVYETADGLTPWLANGTGTSPKGKNFEAVAGTPIQFYFSAETEKSISVTIGEEIVKTLPKLQLDANETVTMAGKTVFAYEFADDLAEGKYKILFTGAFIVSRIQGAGSFYFKINGEDTFESMNGTNCIFMGNYMSGEKNGWTYTATPRETSVTFNYVKGDIIYFSIADGSIPEGSTVADLTLTLQAVS